MYVNNQAENPKTGKRETNGSQMREHNTSQTEGETGELKQAYISGENSPQV